LNALLSPHPSLAVQQSLVGDYPGSQFRAALINALSNHMGMLTNAPPPVPLAFGGEFPANAARRQAASAPEIKKAVEALRALLSSINK
jgi:hypothetical protein